MNKIFYTTIIIICLLACSRKQSSTTVSPPPVPKTKPVLAVHDTLLPPPETVVLPKGYVKGTVMKYELDGCNYIIELDNGEKLEPINLTDEFKNNKMRVVLKFEEQKEMGSICMVGKIVKIIEIKKGEAGE